MALRTYPQLQKPRPLRVARVGVLSALLFGAALITVEEGASWLMAKVMQKVFHKTTTGSEIAGSIMHGTGWWLVFGSIMLIVGVIFSVYYVMRSSRVRDK